MTSTDIRQGTAADYDALGDVMFDAVRQGNSPYTEEQRQSWVGKPRRGDGWTERLNGQSVIVADNARLIVGFMSLADKGYIDFAYIRPSAQGSGIFRRLYRDIEAIAISSEVPRLWVHASLSARAAFEAMGFSIVRKENVEIGKQSLQRFEMEKQFK